MAVLLALSACATGIREPVGLPFPESPPLAWTVSRTGESVCLSVEDGGRLLKFMDQINAFRHAWERLRREPLLLR